MKLSTGKEVEIKKLTYVQREECNDVISTLIHPDESIEFKGLVKARSLWCMYGLGLNDKEELSEYTTDELIEIMNLVKDKANEINPTRPPS